MLGPENERMSELTTAELAARCRLKSRHHRAVEQFARRAGNDVPEKPTLPDGKLRELCARLVLEETLELVQALGFKVVHDIARGVVHDLADGNARFVPSGSEPDLAKICHEAADVRVTATFAMAVSGVTDEAIQIAVDEANLAKFGPGGYRDPETGKWRKPPDHRPADIARLLRLQGET